MQRDNRWDFYKGILMLGVIFGHVLTMLQNGEGGTFAIHAFVRTYDMPMYALISGYFLKSSCNRHSLKYNVLGKLGSIMLPAILWGILFNLIGGTLAISINRFWFLTTIFGCSIIIIVADYIGKRTKKFVTFILLFIAICIFHTSFMDGYKIGFLLVPCVFGYYMEDMKRMIAGDRKKNIIKVIVVSVFVVLWCFWKTDYSVWDIGCDVTKDNQQLANIAKMSVRGLIGITGSLTMMWLWSDIYRLFSASRWVDYLCKIGQNTAELYILQCWIISVAGVRLVEILSELLGVNIFYMNDRILVCVAAPIITVISAVVMYYAQMYIKKIPLVGKYTFNLPLNVCKNSNFK